MACMLAPVGTTLNTKWLYSMIEKCASKGTPRLLRLQAVQRPGGQEAMHAHGRCQAAARLGMQRGATTQASIRSSRPGSRSRSRSREAARAVPCAVCGKLNLPNDQSGTQCGNSVCRIPHDCVLRHVHGCAICEQHSDGPDEADRTMT